MTAEEQQKAKEVVADAVVGIIEAFWQTHCQLSGKELRLGLGTGSTVEPALHLLGKLIGEKRLVNVAGMPTSDRTAHIADGYGIRRLSLRDGGTLDLGFDGADFIDGELLEQQQITHAIKGGGAAHVVERAVAELCDQWIIIADESKVVRSLNEQHWIPLEVPQENVDAVTRALHELGAQQVVNRETASNIKRKSHADNGNPVLEAHFKVVDDRLLGHLNSLEDTFGAKHGLFFNMADQVLIASANGGVKTYRCTRVR